MNNNLKTITAIVINRNLLTTLKATVDFLLKEPRVKVVIYDQQSTYPPLLEYYESCPVDVIYANNNRGPTSAWDSILDVYRTNYFIITDPDCLYDDIPEYWLDVMLYTLDTYNVPKVGFSLRLDDLPETNFRQEIIDWEKKYYIYKNEVGWFADVDTTFALYRPNSPFSYTAIRLEPPYCIKHVPWYLTELNDEWNYYLDNASSVSTWGTRLKNLL